MDTEILWVLMITNVLNNSTRLIKELGISQEKFLEYSSYAAKSSLKRVITAGKKEVGYSIEKATQIIKRELEQRIKNSFPEKAATLRTTSEPVDEQVLTYATPEYKGLLDWATLEEKFVESMVIAIDSFMFFKKSPNTNIHSLTVLALDNEFIIDDDSIALVETSSNFEPEDPLKQTLEYMFDDDKISEKYEHLLHKYWYKVDYPNGKGLTYQLQYFKYYKNFGAETFKYKPIFNVIKENRNNALIMISASGFMELCPILGSILDVLCKNGWSTNAWPVVRKHDSFYYSMQKNEPLKFLLPIQEGFESLYYNILPDLEMDERENHYELLPEFPNKNPLGFWTAGMTLADRTIRSMQAWLDYLQQNISDAFILLFVSGNDEMQRISKKMGPDLYQQTVFAYLSNNVPDNDTTNKHTYLTFARGQASYKYALKLEF